MQTLSIAKRAAILRCVIEGNSVLATSRITGAAKNTIIDLLAKAGEACSVYQSANLRNLPCKVLQLDEIWSFVGCKEKAKKSAINQHPGDVWTWDEHLRGNEADHRMARRRSVEPHGIRFLPGSQLAVFG